VYFDVKEECMEKGCDSKTCKFMGAGTSETVTNSKKYPSKNKCRWKSKSDYQNNY
jgi:hypothetical protein